MKPTRNRFMCPDCGRIKMKFETEKEALGFIKFNSEEINTHGGTLRAYYCHACFGWHITHVEYDEKYERRDQERYFKAPPEKPDARKSELYSVLRGLEFDIFASKKKTRKWGTDVYGDSPDIRDKALNLLGTIRNDILNGRLTDDVKNLMDFYFPGSTLSVVKRKVIDAM